jgi:hypothetical protein
MKYNWSFNIGYYVKDHSQGLFSYYPIQVSDSTPKEFSSYIRENADILLGWAENRNIARSTMVLFVYVSDEDHEWQFRINLINVREFKAAYENWRVENRKQYAE